MTSSEMTNEEAIKILDELVRSCGYEVDINSKDVEALDMAIEALKERDDLLERAYGHAVGQGANGVIREKDVE